MERTYSVFKKVQWEKKPSTVRSDSRAYVRISGQPIF